MKAGLHGDSVENRDFLNFANLPTYFTKKRHTIKYLLKISGYPFYILTCHANCLTLKNGNMNQEKTTILMVILAKNPPPFFEESYPAFAIILR